MEETAYELGYSLGEFTARVIGPAIVVGVLVWALVLVLRNRHRTRLAAQQSLVISDTPQGMRVDQAPPRIRVVGVFVRQAAQGARRELILERSPFGDLLRFRAVNGTWTYRITGYDRKRDVFMAARPGT